MNLTQAVARLKSRGFDYLSDSSATFMLNTAKDALEDESDWPWLETTTATGAAPLTISDLKHVLYVVDTTNGGELRGVDSRDIADLDSNVSTAGTPSSWWLDGSVLKAYPTSTTAQLSVRYVRCSPDLSAGTDTPLIPSRLHPVWVDYAVVEAYKDDDRFNEAQALLNFIRANRLPQMLEVYGDRNRQNPDAQAIVAGSEDW